MNWQTFSQNFIQEAKKLPIKEQSKCLGVLSNLMAKNNQDLAQATQLDKMLAECKIRGIEPNIFFDCLTNAFEKSK